MRIAVIGAGYTGLAAAYDLVKKGHDITVFEKDRVVGGLANTFKQPNWDWPLEKSYHHFFSDDDVLFSLMDELGMGNDWFLKQPSTATLVRESLQTSARGGMFFAAQSRPNETIMENDAVTGLTGAHKKYTDHSARKQQNSIYPFDSPLDLLRFTPLSFLDRIRTGALIAFCKVFPFWQLLEGVTAKQFFKTVGGSAGWQSIWEPLMTGKFGSFASSVSASWLWARIHKRSPRLGYIRGGFQHLADTLASAIRKYGGKIYTNTAISTITQKIDKDSHTSYFITHNSKFDIVLLTVPSSVATKLMKFPKPYEKQLLAIDHLYAQMLILETKEPILEKTYWLNVNDRSFPFIAVVAHTNFMDKTYYGGHHITYIGNYLPTGHPFLSLSAQQLLKIFKPFIQIINPEFNFKFQISNFKLFTLPNAQPVHTLHYSSKAPKLETPIPGVYLANLDAVYPWDRGINYAIGLGLKVAELINR